MLQSIREHTQGWIAGTIITVIILTFALWGIHSYFVSNPANAAVAVVNGEEISRQQLSAAYERLRRQVQAQYGYAAVKDESSLRTRALRNLIDTEVLKQSSKAQGFAVFDAQVDSYMQSMPQFQVDGQFSVERFREMIASSLLSLSEFLDIIHTGLIIDQPRLGLVLTSFALPNEAEVSVALVDQKRDVEYVSIPTKAFETKQADIPQADIDAYYAKHEKDFMTPEQVDVEYIELSAKTIAEKIKPAESALQAYYRDNISSYTKPMTWSLRTVRVPVPATASQDDWDKAKEKAKAVASELKGGADFGTVAKKYEQLKLDKGMLSLNQVPAELQKAVVNLTDKDEVSSPVKTSSGYVVVKVVDVKQPIEQGYEQVKDKVKQSYVAQQSNEKFASLKDQLADLTYAHPDSLQTASDEMGLAIKLSEMFTREQTGAGIAKYAKVREAAFSNDAIGLQNNSDVIQLQPGTVIVLRVKSHIDAKLQPLKDVSMQISSKLKQQRAEKLAAEFSNKLLDTLREGGKADELIAAEKFKWEKAGMVGRYSTKVDTAILEEAFSLPRPNTKHIIAYGQTKSPDGFTVVAVKSVKDGEADSNQTSVFAEQVQNSQGLMEYGFYKQSQIDNAKIKMN